MPRIICPILTPGKAKFFFLSAICALFSHLYISNKLLYKEGSKILAPANFSFFARMILTLIYSIIIIIN